MAVDDLPMPVVTFLNAIGIPWPYINEDQVSEFATLTRQFGTAVQTTHQDATKAVSSIASAHKAVSTQKMSDGWEKLSGQHVTEIVDGCQVLAAALDAAAGYIVAQKVEAIAQLIAMAAEFVADQAAAVATFGIAEAALPLIEEAGEKLMESLVNDLEQYIIGQVVEAAAKPLFAKVETMLSGLDWSQSGAAGGGKGSGVELDAGAVKAQTALLRQHASDMRAHATSFASGVRGLGF
ncbi:MAG: hypothetical protein FWE35_07990 [Streptosporangiales bacterium]|nr:hypothetical protein [Streptosporangiales bacterium]